MARNILLLVVFFGLGFVGWKVWQRQQQTVKEESGDYSCVGCLEGPAKERFSKENSGDTADGNLDRKNDSARVAAQKAADATAPAQAPSMLPPAERSDSSVNASPANPPAYVPTAGQAVDAPYAPPSDSQAANAPNGQRFAGSGAYLVYRQGNLTYRLDTNTGRSCIIFATLEEWRKPIVMSNGCGRSS